MNILTAVFVLCVFAVGFFLVWKYVAEGITKVILLAILAIGLVIWVLNIAGVWHTITGARV